MNRVQHIMDFGDWKIVLAGNRILPYHYKCRPTDYELEFVLALKGDEWLSMMLAFVRPVLTPECIDQDVPFLSVVCSRCNKTPELDIRTAINVYAGKPIL